MALRAPALQLPGDSAWTWLACFVGVDFLYYWFHRKSHEVNAFRAAHVVHHQSEEYNLTVALRQGAFQGWFSWVFYLPLALLGFPPLVFLAVSSFDTLYQFWIHTRTIGRLGPLELVLNTPSNHRVHHARNPKYIDRNLGGTLIVWDRLFGTFGREATMTGANLSNAYMVNGVFTGVNFTNANLTGADARGNAVNYNGATWSNTTCPDGTNSDNNTGSTCVNNR